MNHQIILNTLGALTVGEDTSITVGLALTTIVVVMGAAWRITKAVHSAVIELRMMSLRLEKMEKENYTRAEAAEQALRIALVNPGMTVPDPRDPNEYITVPLPPSGE